MGRAVVWQRCVRASPARWRCVPLSPSPSRPHWTITPFVTRIRPKTFRLQYLLFLQCLHSICRRFYTFCLRRLLVRVQNCAGRLGGWPGTAASWLAKCHAAPPRSRHRQVGAALAQIAGTCLHPRHGTTGRRGTQVSLRLTLHASTGCPIRKSVGRGIMCRDIRTRI